MSYFDDASIKVSFDRGNLVLCDESERFFLPENEYNEPDHGELIEIWEDTIYMIVDGSGVDHIEFTPVDCLRACEDELWPGDHGQTDEDYDELEELWKESVKELGRTRLRRLPD